jgi:hypothetical protein
MEDRSSRALTEIEAIAAINYLYAQVQLVRMTIGGWAFRKRPIKDEILWLTSEIMDAERTIEELVKGPETDGHLLDAGTAALCRQIEEHQAAIDEQMAKAG